MIYWYLFLVQVIVVCIVDLSDFPSSAKKAISWVLTKGVIVKDDYRFHLVDCSLCLCLWSCLIVSLVMNSFSLPVLAYILLLSIFTGITKSVILLVEDVIGKIINKVYEKFID